MTGEIKKVEEDIFVDVSSYGESEFLGEGDSLIKIVERNDFFGDGFENSLLALPSSEVAAVLGGVAGADEF